jgi:hypothetical protein
MIEQIIIKHKNPKRSFAKNGLTCVPDSYPILLNNHEVDLYTTKNAPNTNNKAISTGMIIGQKQEAIKKPAITIENTVKSFSVLFADILISPFRSLSYTNILTQVGQNVNS